jgi:hypothetical protein
MSLHENQIAGGLKRAERDRLRGGPGDNTVRSRKLTMGFRRHAGQCGDCRFFMRTPIGEQNQCLLGKFHCASKHGCALHQPGPPAMVHYPARNLNILPSGARSRLQPILPGLVRLETAAGES